MSRWLAGFEPSLVITITSIPQRKATEYFTERKDDRSAMCLRRPPGLKSL